VFGGVADRVPHFDGFAAFSIWLLATSRAFSAALPASTARSD
jgi:hypothetical protein